MCATRPGPGGRRRAFTLLEMLVALGIGSLVMALVVPLALFAGKSLTGMANYVDLNTSDVNTLDRLTYDVRQAVSLTSFATNRIVMDSGTNGTLTLSFTNGSLIRVLGTQTNTLLTGVDYGEFFMFQRTTISNSYNQYVATNVSAAKLIEVKWTCSRLVMGNKINTENGQTARIVIRKN